MPWGLLPMHRPFGSSDATTADSRFSKKILSRFVFRESSVSVSPTVNSRSEQCGLAALFLGVPSIGIDLHERKLCRRNHLSA